MSEKKISIGDRYNNEHSTPDFKKEVIQYNIETKKKDLRPTKRIAEPEESVRFLMNLPSDIHKKLRNKAFEDNSTIKDLVISAIKKVYKDIL